MRAFFAFPFPGEAKEEIRSVIQKLKSGYPRLKWVQSENLHITLHFLGDINPGQVDICTEILRNINIPGKNIKFVYRGLGRFPPKGKGRVLYLNPVSGVRECENIYTRLEELLSEHFPLEKRRFSPHITLARARVPGDPFPEEEKEEVSGTIRISKIVLFESVLKPSGPIYREVASRDLEGSTC